jgi:predicted nucleic acid-binding Zn finger protein
MVAFVGEQLAGAYCDCDDLAETPLHGIPVCKHVLATGLYCRDKGLIEKASPGIDYEQVQENGGIIKAWALWLQARRQIRRLRVSRATPGGGI